MNIKILGIETSCDETAAAVFDSENGIKSNAIFSQIELHKMYGGVVPEIASRSHIEKINIIIQQALTDAHCTLQEIDAIAVTNRPGLPGSLLVGVCFAKAVAWTLQKPLIGVDHLEGHVFSSFLSADIPFPHLCLTASGGHTSLYYVEDFGKFTVIGSTLDDAAGEAFDKIAKLIGLAYPGGPIIEKLAREINFTDFYSYPRSMSDSLDFSFSGLKTAVLYDLVKKNWYDLQTKSTTAALTHHEQQTIASSLLVCIADIFSIKIKKALKLYPHAKAITFVGGVACNKFIKHQLEHITRDHNKLFFSPPASFCTDNGAMIAFVGAYKARKKQYATYRLDVFENI